MTTDELTLFDYGRILAKRYRFVAGCTLGAVFIAFIVTLLMPKVYRAEATIFVKEQPSMIGSVLGQTGLQVPIPSGALTEYVLAVLNSRSLAEAVVREVHFPLPAGAAAATGQAPGDDERVDLLRRMLSTRARQGLITIGVESSDPVLASDVANAYVRIADKFMLKPATRRKHFIQAQLKDAQQDLTAAEEALERFQQRSRIVALDVETEENVRALTSLAADEARASAALAETTNMMRETGSLVDLAALQTQQAGLLARQTAIRKQIHQMQGLLRSLPPQALQFARLQREAELQLKRYALLFEQYQLASIAEQQEEATFQAIDRATVPKELAKPRPVLNLAFGTLMGLTIGVVGALVLELGDRLEADHEAE